METKNDLIKIEEVTSIMATAPDILTKNKTSFEKCKEAGQSLIDTIENCGEINSDEFDNQVASYIEKAKLTVKNMNERRKPITQILTEISKNFTSFENGIDVKVADTIPYRLQSARNKYASAKLAERKRQEQAARVKLETDNEKVYYKSEYKKGLYSYFNSFLTRKIDGLQSLFTSLSISNFNDNKSKIIGYPETIDVSSLTTNYIESIRTGLLGPSDKMTIRNSVISELLEELKNEFNQKISGKKTELKDLFNSKYNELKQLEEASKSDAEEFERLKKEKAERDRIQEEANNLESQKREREQSEAVERQKQAEKMDNLFSTSATLSTPASKTNAKVSKKITVNNPSGYLSIYQLWFEREGMYQNDEDLAKIHKKMITYCEKLANGKEEETIRSPYIEYIDDVKAK